MLLIFVRGIFYKTICFSLPANHTYIERSGNGNNIIEQYVRFSKKFTEEYHKTKTGKETIENTVKYCIENGILADYLKTREKEVVSIMMELFDQEYATKAYGNSMKKEGIAEGRAEGIDSEKRNVAFRLFRNGTDYNTIIAATAMPYETIAAWHKEYSEQTNK